MLFKWTGALPPSGCPLVHARRTDAGIPHGWNFNGGTKRLEWRTYDTGGTNRAAYPRFDIVLGVQYLAIGVTDLAAGAGEQLKVYLDGTLEDSFPVAIGATIDYGTPDYYAIGQSSAGVPEFVLSEHAVIGRAITEAEVQALQDALA